MAASADLWAKRLRSSLYQVRDVDDCQYCERGRAHDCYPNPTTANFRQAVPVNRLKSILGLNWDFTTYAEQHV